MEIEKRTGTLEDAYMVLAICARHLLLRSREANPRHTYAVARIDAEGHPFDLQVRTERETAERLFCSVCFPSWFK